VTGDDAVELAYDRQADSLGGAIGVSLRLSGYAGTDTGLLGPVREELRKAAQEHAAALLPLPISLHEDDSDLRSAAELLGDITHGDALDSPEAVIRQAGRCRVVVTGSYHGAVFSLSQGVPVVALANSQYYEDKFYGLADMFGVGCELVSPRGSAFARSLASALTRCWDQAPHVRESLLEAARRQIAAGQAAYRKALQGAGGRGGSPHRSRPGG
jgi:colanic acid/amylovoran biosynthesis protein